MTKSQKFIAAVILQVFVIMVVVAFKLVILGMGTQVFLKIAPIDPTSPLRGDYITFQYDISNLNSYLIKGPNIRNGETVYVTLTQNGKYWRASGVSAIKPASGVFIKAKVISGGQENVVKQNRYQVPQNPQLHLAFGIEQYYIPEGTGRSFNFAGEDIGAQVVVDEAGNPVLKRIYIDNTPWP